MKNNLLTICFLGMAAVAGLTALSTAEADPPGMMRYQMMDEETRQRMWGSEEMMRGYGRMGSSWGHGMMSGPMMGGMMMDDFSDLNLSKEQRNKVRSIMQEHRKIHLDDGKNA